MYRNSTDLFKDSIFRDSSSIHRDSSSINMDSNISLSPIITPIGINRIGDNNL